MKQVIEIEYREIILHQFSKTRLFVVNAALVGLLVCGCDSNSGKPTASTAAPSQAADSNSAAAWGGLLVQTAGASLEEASHAIILLHGYGAGGGDLVPLAGALGDGKNVAFLFPQAPIRLESNSYAWWVNDGSQVEQSRQQVIEMINQLHTMHPKCRVSVGGFSQGAALACNLLSEPDLQIEHVILYSARNRLWHEPAIEGHRPKVFLSHGRNDQILPFADAESLKSALEQRGYQVDWHPFDGGHELTYELIKATKDFLIDSAKLKEE